MCEWFFKTCQLGRKSLWATFAESSGLARWSKMFVCIRCQDGAGLLNGRSTAMCFALDIGFGFDSVLNKLKCHPSKSDGVCVCKIARRIVVQQ